MSEGKTFPDFDLKRIGEELNISRRSIANCPVDKRTLEAIYYDYIDNYPRLEKRRLEILSGLNEQVNGKVHSIRSRVKEPDHLIGKIIRSSFSNPGKYHLLDEGNYQKIITDLIGVRIIILDRRDWKGVHQDLLRMYRNLPDRYVRRYSDILTNYDRFDEEIRQAKGLPDCAYHAERPIAYITSEEDRELYSDEFLRLDTSRAHYRSIHYIIRYKECYFEMQMRSLFEEGWLEFDHRMKYPNDQYNKRKGEFVDILSNMANAADHLISFYREEDFRKKGGSQGKTAAKTDKDLTLKEDLSFEEKLRRMF